MTSSWRHRNGYGYILCLLLNVSWRLIGFWSFGILLVVTRSKHLRLVCMGKIKNSHDDVREKLLRHYNDVKMGAMASQITSLTIVYFFFIQICRLKKTSKLRVTGLCAGNSPVTGEFPAQMASYAENVSIWWRHHGIHTKGQSCGTLITSMVVCLKFFNEQTSCRWWLDSHGTSR